MFDGSDLEKELLSLHTGSLTLPVLSAFVKLRLAKLEADHQRGIPFNEAISSDELGLDIMARGVLQDCAVPAVVAVVAAVRLALAGRHRLGAAFTTSRVAGVSRAVAVRHLTNNLTYT